MAQIAGRAGRHMANGTFGATNGSEPFEPREIEAIEGHSFPPLKAIRWRNSELDFADIEALGASLDRQPGLDCLLRVRDAIDHRSLVFLSRRDEIRAVATTRSGFASFGRSARFPTSARHLPTPTSICSPLSTGT